MPRGIESKQAWWYPWLKIGMGSVAGAIATAVSYPIDTVRRRAQVSGALGYEEAIPRGVVGGVAAVIRDDGLRG